MNMVFVFTEADATQTHFFRIGQSTQLPRVPFYHTCLPFVQQLWTYYIAGQHEMR
jgi:hypothetical protein